MVNPLADFVVSLGTDGQIESQGSISDALSKNSELAEEVKHEEEAMELDEDVDQTESVVEDAAGKLVVAEEIEEGHVSSAACEWFLRASSSVINFVIIAVRLFIDALGGKWPVLFWFQYITGSGCAELFDALEMWWLGYWAQQYAARDPSQVSVS